LKKSIEALKKLKDLEDKKKEELHEMIEKKKLKKQTILEKLQMELGRFKHEVE